MSDRRELGVIALRLYDERMRRRDLFGRRLVSGEVAWDLMLLIFARVAGVNVGERSENEIASPALLTRWVRVLVAEGIADGSLETGDLHLLPQAQDHLAGYLSTIGTD